MDKDLNEYYANLYSTNLNEIESNLDKFIEAKHEYSKDKHKIDSDENFNR